MVQIIETPFHLNYPKVEYTKMNYASAILKRTIHQGDVRFDPISQGENAL